MCGIYAGYCDVTDNSSIDSVAFELYRERNIWNVCDKLDRLYCHHKSERDELESNSHRNRELKAPNISNNRMREKWIHAMSAADAMIEWMEKMLCSRDIGTSANTIATPAEKLDWINYYFIFVCFHRIYCDGAMKPILSWRIDEDRQRTRSGKKSSLLHLNGVSFGTYIPF